MSDILMYIFYTWIASGTIVCISMTMNNFNKIIHTDFLVNIATYVIMFTLWWAFMIHKEDRETVFEIIFGE